MKTKLFLSTLLSFYFCLLSSQVPQGFNYQAFAGNDSGNPLINKDLQVKISILSDTILPVIVWEELHSTIKTTDRGIFSLVVGSGVKQSASTVNSFSDIDWTTQSLYIKTQIYYQGAWKNMGSSRLWAVPYSMVAGDLGGALDKLKVKGQTASMDSALFEVKNNTGQIVFAVYNEGVRVYVNDQAKSAKGGFAIGGFGKDKSNSQRYLFVSADSIRAYINDKTKSAKGGFAIGGFSTTKGTAVQFMNVATDPSGIINPSQNRILWYPLKNAFLTGKVLIESPDSVGTNSFASGYESKAKGQYSQALGYHSIARGDYSTAIGKNALANKINSFAFGDGASANNAESYALGKGAIASGYRSFAFGSAGVDSSGKVTSVARALGDYSFAIGQGAQAIGIGSFAIGLADTAGGGYGHAMGSLTHAMGWYSTAMGFGSGAYGVAATSIGFGCYAPGFSATSVGYFGQAIGDYSTSIGYWTWASGYASLALGYRTTSSGYNSTTLGDSTKASGSYSTAMGYSTKALSYCETAIGSYNNSYIVGSTNSWNTSDRLFVIGNGTGTSAQSNAVTVLKNGCIGLQTVTSPTYALQLPNSSTVAVGSGRAYAWTTYSDSRLKENQLPIAYGLKELMELSPMQYIHHSSIDQSTWVNENSLKTIGLIAQEVYKVIPEAVDVPQNNSTGLWGLNYDKLIPVLVKAIQEQQNQIESTNQENHQLKSQVQSLQEKVEQIETQQKEIDEIKTLVNNLIANQTTKGSN